MTTTNDPTETPFSQAMETLSAALSRLIDSLSQTQRTRPGIAEALAEIAGSLARLDAQQRRRRSTKPADRVAVLKALVSIRGAQSICKVYQTKEMTR